MLGFRRRKHRKSRPPDKPRRGDGPSITTLEKFVVEEIELKETPAGPAARPQPKAPPDWLPDAGMAALWLAMWLALVLAALFGRELWAADETRLAAIAWEMWVDGSRLLPRLNAEPYPHPPLYFWLVHAGWKLFGVTDWWPRLLPALAAAASLAVTWRLARYLWPGNAAPARHAPLVLLGAAGFALFTVAAVPDMLRTLCVLLAWWALLMQWRARDLRAWFLAGPALAAGLLAGGPLFLVYVLPLALLAPLWATEGPRPQWPGWYLDLFKATALALAVYFAWLVPAAREAGGGAYAAAQLRGAALLAPLDWFAPARPWWWHLALWPLLLAPWALWPLTWLRLWHIRRRRFNAGMLFCLFAIVPALALLSLFATKQPQHLLPLLPAAALGFAWLLFDDELAEHAEGGALTGMTLPLVLVGGVLAALPKMPRSELLPELLHGLSPLVGFAIMALGMVLAWMPMRANVRRARDLALASVSLAVIALLTLGARYDPLYATQAPAALLAGAERAQRPIAHVGAYAGELHFAARLRAPFTVLAPAEVEPWLARHPNGVLVSYAGEWEPARAVAPLLETPAAGGLLRVWDAGALSGVPVPRK